MTHGAKLAHTNLSYVNLTGDDFSEADFRGTNLAHATLKGTNLTRARLERADLRGDNLETADLREADLTGADPRRADLGDCHGAELAQAWGILRDSLTTGHSVADHLPERKQNAAPKDGARLG